jgi:hypothetical protein
MPQDRSRADIEDDREHRRPDFMMAFISSSEMWETSCLQAHARQGFPACKASIGPFCERPVQSALSFRRLGPVRAGSLWRASSSLEGYSCHAELVLNLRDPRLKNRRAR